MLSAAAVFALSTAVSSPSPDWERIIDEQGIQVWQRRVEGTSLVEFRAQALLEADMRRVAAIIRNNDKKTDWMKNCSENEALRFTSPFEAIIYNRTKSPVFFVSDRDAVVEVNASVVPREKAVVFAFKNVTSPLMPEKEGVVRVPRIAGFWRLVEAGPGTTELTYQVQADPGGSLPKWLVNWASRRIPFDTLAALRLELDKPGYETDQMIVERALDWSALSASVGAATSTSAVEARSRGR